MFHIARRFWYGALCAWLASVLIAGGRLHVAALGDEQQDERVLAEFEIARGGDHIMLPVTVSGKGYSFSFDTGSSACAYDISLLPLLGDPVRTVKVGLINGVDSLKLYKAPAASVGGISLKGNPEVVCLPLSSPSERKAKRPFDGVLGMDVLADKVVEIDFDRGTLRFVRSAVKGRACAIPLKWRQYRKFRAGPFADVTLGAAAGRKCEVLVDTGAGGSQTGWLRSDIFDELLRARAIRVLRSRVPSVESLTGQVTHGRLGRVDSMSLGPFAVEHAGFFELKQSSVSIVGLAYLSRFKVTFDFPASVMYLEKGERYRRADRYDLSGLHIAKRDERIIVTRVDSDSVAEGAGALKNDVIVQVDDLVAASATTKELRQLLSTPGERRVQIDRDGREHYVTLRLGD